MPRSLNSRPLSLELRDNMISRSGGRVGIRQVVRAFVIGEALVDRVVRQDGTAIESAGGSPANVALALGRLGHHPTLITSIGKDRAGQIILDWLAESGVELSVLAPAGSRTATATALLDENGNAEYQFDIDWELDGDIDCPAEVVHIGSIGALIQPGADAVLHFVDRARHRSTITYDPNVRPALIADRDSAVRRIEQLVSLADVVKASEDDLHWLYPELSVEEASAAWFALGPAIVVVTLGADGAFAVTASGRTEATVTPVDVVDTVGAGDTFMGALIDGMMAAGLCGAPRRNELRSISTELLRRLLRRSASAAAVTVSRAGANPPWRHELELAIPSGVPSGRPAKV